MRRFLLIAVFACVLILPVSPASAGVPLVCTLTGTAGNDNLVGTNGDDVICGEGGNDSLTGLKGNDFLDGGPGRDVLLGGRGDDTLFGDTGLDIAGFYDSGNTGVAANLDAGIARGITTGDDVLSSVEDLYGSPGDDDLIGDAQANYLYGRQGNDTFAGREGNDTLVSGDGASDIIGGDGDDAIQPGQGADRVDGGANNDTLKYNDATAGVYVDLVNNLAAGGADGDTISGFENVTGSAFGDTLIATLGATVSVVNGILGDDIISVDDGSGGDTANGGPGTDTCTADAGDTTLNFESPCVVVPTA